MKKGDNNISFGSESREFNDPIQFDRIKSALKEPDVEKIEHKIDLAFSEDIRRTRIWIISAASLLLLVAITVLMHFQIQPRNERIYLEHYAPYSSDMISGIYRDYESEKNLAVYLYFKNKYDDALPIFNNYLLKKPEDTQIKLLSAICLMEGKRIEEAKIRLEEIIHSGNVFFKTDASWYLSLILIKEGDYVSALKILEEIKGFPAFKVKVSSVIIDITGK